MFTHRLVLSQETRNLLIFNLFVPGLCFGLIVWLIPIEAVFQFDPDEGLEITKASLYLQGFDLYTEIWNDQPPLMTVVLAACFKVFGQSVLAARLLILTFSTLLVWSFCQILRRCVSNAIALLCTFLLIVSWKYVILSISVMFGLPAIALAMLAIYFLILYQQKANDQKQPGLLLILLSGVLIGLSLQTKLFTGLIAISMGVQLTIFCFLKRRSDRHSRFRPVLLWIAACLLTFLLIGVAFGSLRIDQLLEAHFSIKVYQQAQQSAEPYTLSYLLLKEPEYMALAVPGLLGLLSQRQSGINFLIPLGWILVVIITLINYQPIWYHYYPLVFLPLIWLAAYGLSMLEAWLRVRSRSDTNVKMFHRLTLTWFVIAFIVSMLAVAFIATVVMVKISWIQVGVRSELEQGQARFSVVERVVAHAGKTQWMFTDVPMYAFRAGIRVPPELAVFSRKRLWSGNLSDEKLCEVLQAYQPEQIVLERFPQIQPGVQRCIQEQPYLRDEYSLNPERTVVHFIAKPVS